MNIRDKILVVEDEKSISGFIKTILTGNGYDVILAHTGAEAFSMISSHCPDLVVLDLGLPDVDGISIIEAVRQWTQLPIIVVSARTLERDKVEALDKGADDYITKPFGVMELISRVKALIRRSGLGEKQEEYVLGQIKLSVDSRSCVVSSENVELTYKEFELLYILMKNAGIVLKRDVLMEKIWGIDFEGESRTLDMHIKTLRQKLGDEGTHIQTVRNVGYVAR